MTIFVPEMLATSGTDGFLHSNLQTGAPRITPPTAPILNCWIQSQKGSLFHSSHHLLPKGTCTCRTSSAWERLKTQKKRREETSGRSSPGINSTGWSIPKEAGHKNDGKIQISQLSPWIVLIFPFKYKNKNKNKDLSKFHLFSRVGYLGQIKSHFC